MKQKARVTDYRFCCHFFQVFKRAECDWITPWSRGWASNMYSIDMKPSLLAELIATATVQQRSVLGFPRPGHAYWDRSSLRAVEQRYGGLGLDMKPYEDALKLQQAEVVCKVDENVEDDDDSDSESDSGRGALEAEIAALKSTLQGLEGRLHAKI